MDTIEVQKELSKNDACKPNTLTAEQIESIRSIEVDALNDEQNARLFEYLMEQVSL
jgi:hypothetical protein